mmetsp:Transcript_9083/g.28920  ORF Transcript_9083/g.28920 Transcript_9083/m.28920 type:complete len:157 (-) Transcript_9083:1089-1559(-)
MRFVFCLLAFALLTPSAVSLSRSECETLGYSEFTLCSTCRELESFLSRSAAADALATECHSCCTPDVGPIVEAERARIIVDEGALAHFGELNRFIEERARAFGKAVEVSFVVGVRTPEIRLFAQAADARSTSQLVIPAQWSTDDIERYISAHVAVY